MRMILNILITVTAAYCVLCLLLFFFQSRLIYFPQIGREDFVTPQQAGVDYQEVRINAAGEELHGWFVPAPQARGVVLFFHGNAGNISHRLDYLRMFRKLGFSILIFDYRGFGKSSGEPSEIGTYQDAEAAWNYLVETRRVAPSSIVLFGESLGGAVAAYLAARVKPRALILTSTFTSLPELGAKLYPLFPVRLLSRFKYDTREYLRRVSCPVLIVHSRDDEIVPFAQGEALYSAAHEPKRFLEILGGHNTGLMVSEPVWFKGVQAFFNSLESKG